MLACLHDNSWMIWMDGMVSHRLALFRPTIIPTQRAREWDYLLNIDTIA